MKAHHFLGVVLVLFLVYLAGAKYPSFGTQVLGKVGL